MYDSKIIELLQKLSSRQLHGFGEFLASPYFNKNTHFLEYFQLLRSFHPEFSSSNVSKSALCNTWSLSEKDLAYRMSELLHLLETYLATAHLTRHPLEQQLRLLEIYSDLGLSKHYEATRRKALKLLEEQPHRDGPYHLYLYQLRELENRHSQQYQRTYREALQQAANALDAAYLTEKLRYSSEMVNAGAVLDVHYDLQLGGEVLAWLQKNEAGAPPAVRLFLSALLMLQHAEEEHHFHHLRSLLQEHEAVLPPHQLKNLYTYLLNFCTRRINHHRDNSYYDHFLEINEILLQKGMLLEDGVLAPWRFSNLVTAGLRTRRMQWVQKFMEDYKKLLPEAFRDNIFNYNRAHYLYWQQEYDKAQVILNQLDLRDLLLAVAAKNLLIKIYYETGQTELLLSFLEAYRIYMHRQELAKPTLKKQVRNLIDFTRKLAKIPPFEASRKEQLLETLPPATEVLEWEWLRRMAE